MSSGASAVRVAMWSGPRNISTAMMRAWENRGDTAVWDEPFYAGYLDATGIDHPLDTQVIAAGETDWRRVVERLTGDVPDGHPVFFQKHMTHHLLPLIDRGWMDAVVNCFLIRNPREVLASYARMRSTVTVRTWVCCSRRKSSISSKRDAETRRSCSMRATCWRTRAGC